MRNSKGGTVFKCLLCKTEEEGEKIRRGFRVQERKMNDLKRISFFLSGHVIRERGKNIS
jgi:hypothetical protein